MPRSSEAQKGMVLSCLDYISTTASSTLCVCAMHTQVCRCMCNAHTGMPLHTVWIIQPLVPCSFTFTHTHTHTHTHTPLGGQFTDKLSHTRDFHLIRNTCYLMGVLLALSASHGERLPFLCCAHLCPGYHQHPLLTAAAAPAVLKIHVKQMTWFISQVGCCAHPCIPILGVIGIYS